MMAIELRAKVHTPRLRIISLPSRLTQRKGNNVLPPAFSPLVKLVFCQHYTTAGWVGKNLPKTILTITIQSGIFKPQRNSQVQYATLGGTNESGKIH